MKLTATLIATAALTLTLAAVALAHGPWYGGYGGHMMSAGYHMGYGAYGPQGMMNDADDGRYPVDRRGSWQGRQGYGPANCPGLASWNHDRDSEPNRRWTPDDQASR